MSTLAPPLLELAARGLPGVAGAEVHPVTDRLDEVEAHGLAGLLVAAHDAGDVHLAPSDRARLDARLDAEAQLAVRLEAELLRLAPVLERHDGVVLKGPGLAHHAAAAPELRPFSDLDLLVAPSSVELVLRDLARLGYERPRPDPAPGYAARVAKATAVVHPTGLLVDLHRTITLGAAGELVPVAELLERRVELTAGPVRFPAPAWPAHLLVVALHAAVGDGLRRPRSLRDVIEVAHHPEQDPAAAAALAAQWGASDQVAIALRAARDLLGATLPEPLDALAALAPAGAIVPADAAEVAVRERREQLEHASGLRARGTLARALVAPTPSFLRWTYGDRPLPALYAQRWHDLRERGAATDARATVAPTPVGAEP